MFLLNSMNSLLLNYTQNSFVSVCFFWGCKAFAAPSLTEIQIIQGFRFIFDGGKNGPKIPFEGL